MSTNANEIFAILIKLIILVESSQKLGRETGNVNVVF